jgi:hypothetical protein
MTDVMIDLETLDTKPTATILSIGAVEFNPTTGQIGREYHSTIQWDQPGRTISTDTVKWWMTQSEAARMAVMEGGRPLLEVLTEFWHWLPDNPTVWGNGSCFDISIMDHAFNYNSKWKLWAVNDVRTIVRLARGIVNRPSMQKGTAHNALDDARHQAIYVSSMWQALRKDR